MWKLAMTGDGSPTLLHPVHGSACHSDSGAWLEARERFAVPCQLAERGRQNAPGGAIVRLLDIGTGLGLNLAAALEAVEGQAAVGEPGPAGPRLDIVTLERDPEVIRATLALFGNGREPVPSAARLDPQLERWFAPVRRALDMAVEAADVLVGSGIPVGERSRLRLFVGDARVTLPKLPAAWSFDAVFLDPFGLRVEPELWGAPFVPEVARRMAPGSLLSTYSSSLGVRAALASAGLRVGLGPAVGRKVQGTLASPDLDLPALDARTQRKLERRLERDA